MRIITLNVNHRTQYKPVTPQLVQALDHLSPDIFVLTEFVAGGTNQAVDLIGEAGHETVVSKSIERSKRRWCNQILIASRTVIKVLPAPSDPPSNSSGTNFLSVKTGGVHITGIRVPVGHDAQHWRNYWNWLVNNLHGDLVIGDFNIDPSRRNSRDRVALETIEQSDWQLYEPKGEWSYKSSRGHSSKIDHVLYGDGVHVHQAEYIPDPFYSELIDHAALVVDFELRQ